MLTWLDRLVAELARDCREAFGRTLAPGISQDPLALASYYFAGLAYSAAQQVERDLMGDPETEAVAVESLPTPGLRRAASVFPYVAPFLTPDALQGTTFAVQVTPELHEDFRGASPPDLDLGDVLKSTLYLDFPGRKPVNEDLALEAIFIRPTDRASEPGAIISAMAQTARPGQGALAVLRDTSGSECYVVWQFGHPDAQVAVNVGGVAQPIVNSLDDLARLVMAYYSVHAEVGTRLALPVITTERLKALASDKKRQAKMKSASLFSVTRLLPPPGRFGRSDASREGSGYRLDHRVPVRGHFRMQAHGEGRALRKLIWVDGFERGPKDGPSRQRLVVLD